MVEERRRGVAEERRRGGEVGEDEAVEEVAAGV